MAGKARRGRSISHAPGVIQVRDHLRIGSLFLSEVIAIKYRQPPLPEGALTEKAGATFTNGVLEVTMPAPTAEPTTRKLEGKESQALPP